MSASYRQTYTEPARSITIKHNLDTMRSTTIVFTRDWSSVNSVITIEDKNTTTIDFKFFDMEKMEFIWADDEWLASIFPIHVDVMA